MKTEDLMNAIENIDDRFVEESAYGVRPKTRIPWGLIATAACFCLVIGAVIFMGQAGLMPMLPGQGTTATQPAPSTDTQPSYEDTVTPTGYATLDDAIIDVYYNKYLKEQAEKMVTEGWAKDESEIRASVSVRHIASYGDVYAVFMGDNVFAYSQAFRKEDVGGLIFEFTSGQPLMIYRNYDITQLADAYAQDWLTDDQLAQLQTHFEPGWYTDPTEPSDPTQPTVPEDTVGPVDKDSQLSWFQYVFNCLYDSPREIDLSRLFAAGFPEESRKPTEQELQLLKGYDPESDVLIRLPKKRMHTFLQDTFGIALTDMPRECFAGLTYLEETDCYYLWGENLETVGDVIIGNSQSELPDPGGEIIFTEYRHSGAEDTYVFAMQWDGSGYRVLFNRKGSIADENGDAEELKGIDTLFADMQGWYNRVAGHFYESPEDLRLRYLFGSGFPEESKKPTDAEWKELEGNAGYDRNYDLIRLPVDKMDKVLNRYFGISVADLPGESFAGLTYLESTNCWYFMSTVETGYAEAFQATALEVLSDGIIQLTYTIHTNGVVSGETVCQMGLSVQGENYQILYNRVRDPEMHIGEGQTYDEVARIMGSWGKPNGEGVLAYRWELPDGNWLIVHFEPKIQEISHVDPNNVVVHSYYNIFGQESRTASPASFHLLPKLQ